MAYIIQRLKINTWFDFDLGQKMYGVDAKVGMQWYHLKDNIGPIWFFKRKEASQYIKALKDKEELKALAVLDKRYGKCLDLN